jgi:hypothetical protein
MESSNSSSRRNILSSNSFILVLSLMGTLNLFLFIISISSFNGNICQSSTFHDITDACARHERPVTTSGYYRLGTRITAPGSTIWSNYHAITTTSTTKQAEVPPSKRVCK